MLKFFRNIRRRLLSESKFYKYLFYAVGEILLVVIGILFALQINNWNEDRKSDIKLKSYVQNLISDIVTDTIKLESQIKRGTEMQANIRAYFKYFESGENSITDLIDSAKQVKLNLYRYLPVNYTFQDMQQSGNSALLDAKERESLVELSNEQEFLKIIFEKTINDIKAEQLKRNEYLDFDLSGSDFNETVSWEQSKDRRSQGLLHFHNYLTNFSYMIEFTRGQSLVVKEKSRECLHHLLE